MSVNKVVYGGNTLIDLSSDTVAANKMLSGIKAHDKSGAVITGSIASQGAQTITPGTANKTIAAGKYLSGKQTIKGDANLVAGNIKSGVSIFGVAGSYEGSGGSGGGVETCTVRLQGNSYMKLNEYAYTCIEDGAIVNKGWLHNNGASQYESFDITLENVVVNSTLTVGCIAKYSLGASTNKAHEFYQFTYSTVIFFGIDAASGETATIYFDGDD